VLWALSKGRVHRGLTHGRLEGGYSLQANVKTAEGGQHVDRDAQFGYLNEQAVAHMATGDAVISVDSKKKELVGNSRTAAGNGTPRVNRSR
jgi:hypothetical protein